MAWDVFERIYSDNNFMTGLGGGGFVQDYPKYGAGDFLRTFIAFREPDVCTWVFDAEEFDRAAHFISDRLLNDDQWRTRLYRDIDVVTRQYFTAGERLRRLPIETVSNSQLLAEFRRILPLQRRHHVMSTVANGVVTDGRNHLSNKIRCAIASAIRVQPDEFNALWSELTQVTRMSLRQRKEYALARLARAADRLSRADVRRRLKRLHARYCWLTYQYRGPAQSFEQLEGELADARRDAHAATLPQTFRTLRRQQDEQMRRLHFDARSRFLVRFAQFVIWQKGFRKDVQYHSFYCFEHFFRALARARRVDDWTTLTFLFPWEVEGFITTGQPSVRTLEERRKLSCIIVHPRSVTVKLGNAARRYWDALGLPTDLSVLREARGQCAYAGRVRGVVKVVQVPADMAKMTQGDILVSQATSPDLLPAIRKAAAIVTNTGGLICHAAITSRELKIPCIVGTTNATLIFKDGDAVDVDARAGTIRKLL